MYPILRRLLFQMDPEAAHRLALAGLAWTSRQRLLRGLLERTLAVHDPRLAVSCCGLRFPNPIGLAAGFDKNAVAVRSWPAVGFGFVEIGSVTFQAQPGNPRPRLFRLPEEEALINRLGFNNDGAKVIAARLQALRQTPPPLPIPLGVNVGRSRSTEPGEAAEDYRRSLELLSPTADYLAINVSSPNTPGLRELQEREALTELLTTVSGAGSAGGAPQVPLLLKIAPDLTDEQLDDILELAEHFALAGIIATNTTIAHGHLASPERGPGGLSGRPLREMSYSFLRRIRQRSSLPIISVGGVATVTDVIARLRAGASLVQLYTALVYQGPLLPGRLNRGILRWLEDHGVASIEALHEDFG